MEGEVPELRIAFVGLIEAAARDRALAVAD